MTKCTKLYKAPYKSATTDGIIDNNKDETSLMKKAL
ncbi:MAG: hypothetical protein ACI8WB_000802 [Phenylobacterium sp.]|jgi:hypothetical protein